MPRTPKKPAFGLTSAPRPDAKKRNSDPKRQSQLAGEIENQSDPDFPFDNQDAQDDATLTRKVLREIMQDAAAPAASRAQAARTLAEMQGLLGRHSKPATEDNASPTEMSLAQIEAELAAMALEQ